MSADVLIGQAYYLRFDPKLMAAAQPYAPLGALYAAAVVRERGYRVALFDAMLAESEAEWAASLDRHAPRVAVIYEDNFNYLSKMCLLRMREAALTMIAAATARGVPVIVAGSDATDHASVYLEGGAALVVVGEGELSLVDALDTLTGRNGAPLSQVAGLALRGAARGTVARTAARDVIRDLDALPRPAWDLVDVDRYRAVWLGRHGYFSMSVATTRGCPYHCNWCAKPIYGQRYNARSAEHVVDEIAWLVETYKPDHIWIADDIFGLKPGWIEQFSRLAVARRVVTPFKCLMRADGVTRETARALASAGCQTVWIGAESGSQRVLDAMEKGTRVDQIESAAGHLHEAGIEVGFFLQFGYPGETLQDIERTIDMVRRCRPDDIGISVSYPLPGTTFYDRVRAGLGDKQNWIDSDDLALMYRGTYVPEFYRALHARVHAEFRLRRALDFTTRRRRWRKPRAAWRDMAAAFVDAARVQFLKRRVNRLALEQPPRSSPARGETVRIPLLTRQAAAVPTEQPR
jgi:radical SAM superfamily enzyme YgiQ (UPF0313 family)